MKRGTEKVLIDDSPSLGEDTASILDMDLEAPSAFDLPAELLNQIGSYLSYQDLLSFGCASRGLHARLGHAWLALLQRLKEIDPSVPIASPDNGYTFDWQQPRFKEHFVRIADSQWQEILHFKQEALDPNFFAGLDDSLLKQLDEAKKPLNLETLEQRHQLLNKINIFLIKRKIDTNSTELDVSICGLTRFPSALFEDTTLGAYWARLQRLYCKHNQLQSLPESIGGLQALQRLYCYSNQLQSLPESIGRLQALQWLNCDSNQLQSLPESIGGLRALQRLLCGSNQLQSLPESIGRLRALEGLICANNRLQSLPESIKRKFGLDWCTRALSRQSTNPPRPGF